MMKQHTAVEWLVEKLSQLPQVDERFESEFNTWQDVHEAWDKMRYQLIEQALQMEKEQTIQFHIECMKAGLIVEGERKWDEDYGPIVKSIAEKHYSETYENPNT